MSNSKVIFWNIWGHRYADGIHEYLEKHSDADVFCLTEVTDVSERQINKNGHNLVYSGDEAAAQVDGRAQLQAHFGDKRQIFYDTADYRNWKCTQTGARFSLVGFGSALAVSDTVFVVGFGVQRIDFSDRAIRDRIIQWMIYQKGNTRFLLAHLHGVWIKGNTKGDHVTRIYQTMEIRRLLQSLSIRHNVDKIIFGGDLNLDIDTEAISLLEGDGMLRNLIREFKVGNTRTAAYRHLGLQGHSMYADYVLVSKEVEVENFEVATDITASDHAPLVVEFS